MGDAKPPSISLAKLRCKATSLENELYRYRAEAQNAAAECKRLRAERDAIEQAAKTSQSKWRERETGTALTVKDLQEQVERQAKEKEALNEELQMTKAELKEVLETREEAQVHLKAQNEELERKGKNAEEQLEAVMKEMHCQRALANALDSAIKSMNTHLEQIQGDVIDQEMQLKSGFETMQGYLVDSETLLRQLEEQKVQIDELTAKVSQERLNIMALREQLETEKQSTKEWETKVSEAEEELKCAHLRIEEERKHKTRLLDLLRSSEDLSIKIEETTRTQANTIQELHRKIQELQRTEDKRSPSVTEISKSASVACTTVQEENAKDTVSQLSNEAAGETEERRSIEDKATEHAETDSFVVQAEASKVTSGGSLSGGKRKSEGLLRRHEKEARRSARSKKVRHKSLDEKTGGDCMNDFFSSS